MTDPDLDAVFQRAVVAARALPGIEHGTSYGTPALKVRGKLLARVKDADTLVLMCAAEDKEMLLAAAPEIYFETDHYKGWGAILVRMSLIADDELAHRLEQVWCMKAPKSLVKAFGACG